MSEKTETQAKVKFGDKEYNVADLSEVAHSQLQSWRYADMEVKRLNMQLALLKTAQNAYQNALVAELNKMNN